MGVLVAVCVGVSVAVSVGVEVGVCVMVGVRVGVPVAPVQLAPSQFALQHWLLSVQVPPSGTQVAVGVEVGVEVAVLVGVEVFNDVGVKLGVGVPVALAVGCGVANPQPPSTVRALAGLASSADTPSVFTAAPGAVAENRYT